MNNSLRKLWVLPILVMMLMTACSSPEETSSSNNNAAQPSNSNTAPPVATRRDSPVIPNNSNVSPPPVKGKSPAARPVEPGEKAPKLVAPTKTIEFGKQPQDKTLVRTFQIRNTGNADLQIENVQPG